MNANSTLAQDHQLPLLRSDLEIYLGPSEPDGSPTFTVHDPVAGTYDKIGWEEATVLRHLWAPWTLKELVRRINRSTTLDVDETDVLALCEDAKLKGLTRSSGVAAPRTLLARHDAMKISPLKWLLTHYLFVRIPLIRPDTFLTRTVGLMGPLGSRIALLTYAGLSILGLIMLTGHVDTYLSTFPYFFNLRGLLFYVAAIVVLKTVHEFSHAYVAKSYGVRVPTMGVALLVFFPVAFCDVTDAWRLRDRRQRLLIGAAGILAELIIAGLALFVWGVTPPGMLRSVAFVVSSVTIVSTVIVNLNPAMRFDGYYILADAWGIDNLQPRAFAVTRWWLRKALLGLNAPAPEHDVPPRRLAGMVIYSLYSWLWRLGLYMGIAAVVYHKFTKAIGVVLFSANIVLLFARPLVNEARAIATMRKHLRLNLRLLATSACLLGLLLWLAAPLSRTVSLPAIVVPTASQSVYVPHPGVIDGMALRLGDRVEAGQSLLRIRSERLRTELQIFRIEKQVITEEIAALSADPEARGLLPQKREELAKVEAKLSELREAIGQSHLTAQVSGYVIEWDESLRNGQPVAEDAVLGKIAATDRPQVIAFVKEGCVDEVQVNEQVEFVPIGDWGPRIGRVRHISPTSTESLSHFSLSSLAGGDLPVLEDQAGRLRMVESYYRIEVHLDPGQEPLRLEQTGHVRARTKPRSLLLAALRHVCTVLARESSF